jgi:hypothetical protein
LRAPATNILGGGVRGMDLELGRFESPQWGNIIHGMARNAVIQGLSMGHSMVRMI